MLDQRAKYVPIGCQRCIECTKQKANGWRIRLLEHIKTNTNGKFVTLTFSNQEYADLFSDLEPSQQTYDYQMENAIATLAIRRFLERHRKQYKQPLQHWLVTELGHNGTENIHVHGIIWTNHTMDTIEKLWQYGHVWKGKKALVKIGKHITSKTINYVNERTIGYITKYVTKIDAQHKTYTPKILTSPAIGKTYATSYNAKSNTFQQIPHSTDETYRTRTGHKMALPIYYRNKLYTDHQREKLWMERLDKDERWICGEHIKNYSTSTDTYQKLLQWHQKRNQQLGYGMLITWEQQHYERTRRRMLAKKRINAGFAREPKLNMGTD